jgi:VanZ family protein
MRAERIRAGLSRILDARTAGRLAAVLCIVLLAIMPLVPAKTMVLELSGELEHVIAYAATTFLLAIAFGKRHTTRIVIALVLFAGIVEFLQHFSPGRTPSLWDYMFSVAGILAGGVGFVLLKKWLAQPTGLTQR